MYTQKCKKKKKKKKKKIETFFSEFWIEHFEKKVRTQCFLLILGPQSLQTTKPRSNISAPILSVEHCVFNTRIGNNPVMRKPYFVSNSFSEAVGCWDKKLVNSTSDEMCQCGCCVARLWMRWSAFSPHAPFPVTLAAFTCLQSWRRLLCGQWERSNASSAPAYKDRGPADSLGNKTCLSFLLSNSFPVPQIQSAQRCAEMKEGLVLMRLNRLQWCFLRLLSHIHSKSPLIKLNVH